MRTKVCLKALLRHSLCSNSQYELLVLVNHLCRSFKVLVAGVAHQRHPSTILGGLCRLHFPGVVNLAGVGAELAWTFQRYEGTPDTTDVLGRNFGNKALWVIKEMWVRIPRTSLLTTSHSSVLHIMTVYIACTCRISLEWSLNMRNMPITFLE